MKVTRREFLKYCTVAAGALGLSAAALFKLKETLAKEGGVQIVWLQGASCSGCSVSLLNTIYYATIQELLLATPASTSLDLQYHPTLMAAAGDLAAGAIDNADLDDQFVLAVEGSIQTGTPYGGSQGDYCHIGKIPEVGSGSITMQDAVDHYANLSKCRYVLAIGTCSSFGGIPAGNPNPTGAKGVTAFFKDKYGSLSSTYRSLRNKTINIPGCPPNPNWIVGTIAYLIAHNLDMPKLDALRRPTTYYGERICNNCERFEPSKSGNFIDNRKPNEIGDPTKRSYCLKYIGCKGSRTKSDCSIRKWHSPGYSEIGINWCVGAGSPCQGCTQDGFPDRMSPFHYIR